MYQYKMVQIPPNVSIKAGQSQQPAADYLQQVVDQYSQEGWDFYSIESMSVTENAGCGCLAMLLGLGPQRYHVYVIVFRRSTDPSGIPPVK